jgi:hypothetical protein
MAKTASPQDSGSTVSIPSWSTANTQAFRADDDYSENVTHYSRSAQTHQPQPCWRVNPYNTRRRAVTVCARGRQDRLPRICDHASGSTRAVAECMEIARAAQRAVQVSRLGRPSSGPPSSTVTATSTSATMTRRVSRGRRY